MNIIRRCEESPLSFQERLNVEETRLDAEKGMFLLEGALHLLIRQQEESKANKACALCLKKLDSPHLLLRCDSQLEMKKEKVKRTRIDDAVAIHDQCVLILKGKLKRRVSTSRLAFYRRLGSLSEYRAQKMECLNTMTCVACSRVFESAEECSRFLQRVDSLSSVMERELHVHAPLEQLCPVVHNSSSNAAAPILKRHKGSLEDNKDKL